MIEQDHRRIKQRIRPMLGFKRFDSAAVTISGIELMQKFSSINLKSAHWAAAQRQCRNFATPC
jgi:putative transposase